MDTKELTNIVVETLREDGFFENKWIDEHKFRPRFYNSVKSISLSNDLGHTLESLFTIAEEISSEIISENVTNTMDGLVEKNIVSRDYDADGELTYSLNKDYNG